MGESAQTHTLQSSLNCFAQIRVPLAFLAKPGILALLIRFSYCAAQIMFHSFKFLILKFIKYFSLGQIFLSEVVNNSSSSIVNYMKKERKIKRINNDDNKKQK